MRAFIGGRICGVKADAHYEVSIAHNVNGARVKELKVIKEQDEVFRVDRCVLERVEVGTERCLQVVYGRDRLGTEPGLDMR